METAFPKDRGCGNLTYSPSDHKHRRRARFDFVGLMGEGVALRIRVANHTTCRLRAAADSDLCWFLQGA